MLSSRGLEAINCTLLYPDLEKAHLQDPQKESQLTEPLHRPPVSTPEGRIPYPCPLCEEYYLALGSGKEVWSWFI